MKSQSFYHWGKTHFNKISTSWRISHNNAISPKLFTSYSTLEHTWSEDFCIQCREAYNASPLSLWYTHIDLDLDQIRDAGEIAKTFLKGSLPVRCVLRSCSLGRLIGVRGQIHHEGIGRGSPYFQSLFAGVY